MRILISNDDGYLAPGLQTLFEALQGFGELEVVAPEQNSSGMSNSLTLSRPLSVKTATNGFHYVNGTPSDCVHIALTGLLAYRPDLVVSGINNGVNMGDDTLYSGTVGAAMEGYLFGIPSVAFSLEGREWQHLDSARRVVRQVMENILHQTPPTPAPWLLNVNIPSRPFEQIKGYQVCRLGKRHASEPVITQQSPRGETIYWIGPAGHARDGGPGTDFHALEQGYVSLTPIQIDLTDHARLQAWQQWPALRGQD